MQASQLYPLDEGSPLQVRSHQLFAACALFQATGELRYWNDTLTLYDLYFDALDQDLLDSPLYNPSANYRNPQWYALLCMAQSAPDASNIADDPLLAVPEHVDPSAESVGNETAAGWRRGQRAQYRQYLAAQLPETGTRMEVMRQLSNNFVYPWLTLQSQGSGGAFAQNDRLRCGLVLCCAVLCCADHVTDLPRWRGGTQLPRPALSQKGNQIGYATHYAACCCRGGHGVGAVPPAGPLLPAGL